MSNHSISKTKNLDKFKDNSKTNEYKMAVCDPDTNTDLYFFEDGVS